MKERGRYVVVLFSALRPLNRKRRVSWLRLARRFPRLAKATVYARMVEWLTDSDLCHLAIGHGGAVFDPSLAGDRFYAMHEYVVRYPGLSWVAVVSVEQRPDLDRYKSSRTKTPWLCVLGWFTRGLTPSRDCVRIVRRILIDAGYPVPRRVVSPIGMLMHLREGSCRLHMIH